MHAISECFQLQTFWSRLISCKFLAALEAEIYLIEGVAFPISKFALALPSLLPFLLPPLLLYKCGSFTSETTPFYLKGVLCDARHLVIFLRSRGEKMFHIKIHKWNLLPGMKPIKQWEKKNEIRVREKEKRFRFPSYSICQFSLDSFFLLIPSKRHLVTYLR